MSLHTSKVMLGGRGRGRLIPQEVLDAPLRRPGMLLPEKSNITDKLARLDILFTGPLEDLVVYRVLDVFLFREGCTDADIEKMLDYIFKNALIDATNVDFICKYLYVMFQHAEKGATLRSLFYNTLQKYYQESSNLKCNQSNSQYRNFVRLFASATHHCRNVNFAPFNELIDALFDLAISLVPSAVHEDIKLFSLSVIRYSNYLKMRKPDGNIVDDLPLREARLEEAKSISRKICLNCKVSNESLAWLMLVIEYKSINHELLVQYSPPLDASSILLLKQEVLNVRLPRKDFDRFSLGAVSKIIELV